jgi:hypothetical protein
MNSETLLFLAIGCAGVVIGAVAVLLILRRRCSQEWNRLAERFAAQNEPKGKEFNRHTVKVGPDLCRHCVKVVVADPGLYLRANGFILRRPGVLVPWDQFRDVSVGKLDLNKAAVLTLGHPSTTLIMPMRLYERVRSHMPGHLRRRV